MSQETRQWIDLLIDGAYIVTMDDQWQVLEDAAVAVDRGLILDIGKPDQLIKKFQPKKRLDASDQVLMPGLVNAHTHAATSLFRGFADDRPLDQWLHHFIWPAEARFINPDTVYTGTLLAMAEMIRGGTTTFMDMYFFEEVVAQVAQECGMRVVLGEALFDNQGPNKLSFDQGLAYSRHLLRKYAQEPLVTVSVQPHSVYTVSHQNLARAKALADEFDAVFALHASETAAEVADVRQKTRQTPPRLLHQQGFLGKNVALFHAVHLDDEEIDLLAQTGTSVVHCPDSNLKLGSGIARLPELLKAGVSVGLGTDGPASNNDLNLWDEVQLAAKLHLGVAHDPTVVSARQVVYMATRGGAQILGLGDKIGSIQPGMQADLILLNFKQPHLLPLYDIYSHLAYIVGRADIHTTIVHGKPLMVERRLVTLDEEALYSQVQELGGKINNWLVAQKRLYN